MTTMPRIYRGWNARRGVFVWTCTPLPEGKWGTGVSQQLRYDWRQAEMWVARTNAKEHA